MLCWDTTRHVLGSPVRASEAKRHEMSLTEVEYWKNPFLFLFALSAELCGSVRPRFTVNASRCVFLCN